MSKMMIDDVTRVFRRFGVARRTLFAAAVGGAFGAVTGHRRVAAGVGCRNVGKACRRGEECCSGVCRGPKGKRSCRAHHVGTCLPGEDICREGFTAVCNDGENCYCAVTSGGAPFCGQFDVGACTACRRDADCAEQGFPAGSACVRMSGEFCPACPILGFTAPASPRAGPPARYARLS
jgi:hypothetical protein